MDVFILDTRYLVPGFYDGKTLGIAHGKVDLGTYIRVQALFLPGVYF